MDWSRLYRYGATAGILVVAGILGTLFYQEIQAVVSLERDQSAFRDRVVQLTDEERGGGSWDPDRLDVPDRSAGSLPESLPEDVRTGLRDQDISTDNLPDRLSDLSLRTLEGDRISARDLHGKWILLNFWATWCAICQTEAPTLQNLNEAFRDAPLRVVGVNIQQEPSLVRDYVRHQGLDYRILLDRDGNLANEFYVTGVPETILIDPEGTVIGRFLSYRDWNNEELRSLLRGLLEG